MDVGEEETAVEGEAVGANATSTSMRGMRASRGTIGTLGMARTAAAAAGISGEEGITNPRTTHTLPQLKPRAIRMGGTHHKATTLTTSRAGIEDHLSRHTIRGPRISNLPTEVAEEGTIQDMMARTAGRMDTVELEVALLPREEVPRMAAAMALKGVREGGMGTVVTVVDTTSPHRTAVTAEVVTTEAVDINQVEPTNPVGVINLAEDTRPVGHTAPASSLTGTREDTTKEAEGEGEGTDYPSTQPHAPKNHSGLLPYFPPTLGRFKLPLVTSHL